MCGPWHAVLSSWIGLQHITVALLLCTVTTSYWSAQPPAGSVHTATCWADVRNPPVALCAAEITLCTSTHGHVKEKKKHSPITFQCFLKNDSESEAERGGIFLFFKGFLFILNVLRLIKEHIEYICICGHFVGGFPSSKTWIEFASSTFKYSRYACWPWLPGVKLGCRCTDAFTPICHQWKLNFTHLQLGLNAKIELANIKTFKGFPFFYQCIPLNAVLRWSDDDTDTAIMWSYQTDTTTCITEGTTIVTHHNMDVLTSCWLLALLLEVAMPSVEPFRFQISI